MTISIHFWKSDEPLTVGVYAMKHMNGSDRGSLVRIDREIAPGMFSVQYVQLLRDGSISNGGGSSSWSSDNFKPVTSPALILAAECSEAYRQAHESEFHAKNMRREAEIRTAAIAALIRSGVQTFDHCGSPIVINGEGV